MFVQNLCSIQILHVNQVLSTLPFCDPCISYVNVPKRSRERNCFSMLGMIYSSDRSYERKSKESIQTEPPLCWILSTKRPDRRYRCRGTTTDANGPQSKALAPQSVNLRGTSTGDTPESWTRTAGEVCYTRQTTKRHWPMALNSMDTNQEPVHTVIACSDTMLRLVQTQTDLLGRLCMAARSRPEERISGPEPKATCWQPCPVHETRDGGKFTSASL
ncbi:hypothetical protein IWX49DRAFT_382649 [Phyllosticta citricarpa]|uniref:Uncharacterized protein n=1 Tax=Phyllosticta paracitricarpa TaxID=2016321 RepID=A0ABR1MT31_9PEZI